MIECKEDDNTKNNSLSRTVEVKPAEGKMKKLK
jgi:hypothetical protein